MTPRSDEDYEELLQRSRPTPTPAWLHETERALLGAPAPARSGSAPAWRRGRLLAGAAAGLGAVIVAAGLAGGGPLAADGGDDARAKPGCEVVYVTEVERAGQVVQAPDGTVRVETTRQPVTREVERCR